MSIEQTDGEKKVLFAFAEEIADTVKKLVDERVKFVVESGGIEPDSSDAFKGMLWTAIIDCGEMQLIDMALGLSNTDIES